MSETSNCPKQEFTVKKQEATVFIQKSNYKQLIEKIKSKTNYLAFIIKAKWQGQLKTTLITEDNYENILKSNLHKLEKLRVKKQKPPEEEKMLVKRNRLTKQSSDSQIQDTDGNVIRIPQNEIPEIENILLNPVDTIPASESDQIMFPINSQPVDNDLSEQYGNMSIQSNYSYSWSYLLEQQVSDMKQMLIKILKSLLNRLQIK